MSYILDALKKIEHEKNKRVQPGGRPSITGDLFQERIRPAANGGFWKAGLLVVVVSLIACTGTWYALHGRGQKGEAVIRAVSSAPAHLTSTLVPPVIPMPVQAQSATVAVPNVSLPTPVRPATGETDEDDAPPVRKVRVTKKKATVQLPHVSNQVAQAIQVPADIKLSGIAWQDDRAGRRAVINGFLLKEGAVVSGAKIVDIQAGKVRFSSSAGPFEIKLDAVLPAEAKK